MTKGIQMSADDTGFEAELRALLAEGRKIEAKDAVDEVCTYHADVDYGVSSHARFTLYKLGYRKDDTRRGEKPEVLLGDADYVINLP